MGSNFLLKIQNIKEHNKEMEIYKYYLNMNLKLDYILKFHGRCLDI